MSSRSALELAEPGPHLRLDLGRDDLRRRQRALEAARDRAVEADASQGVACGPRLVLAFASEWDALRPHRPAAGLEVRDLRVAHEIDAPAHQE
jgi:hypothetical protein